MLELSCIGAVMLGAFVIVLWITGAECGPLDYGG